MSTKKRPFNLSRRTGFVLFLSIMLGFCSFALIAPQSSSAQAVTDEPNAAVEPDELGDDSGDEHPDGDHAAVTSDANATEVPVGPPPTFGNALKDSVVAIGESFENLKKIPEKVSSEFDDAEKSTTEKIQGSVNVLFGSVVGVMASILFFGLPIGVVETPAGGGPEAMVKVPLILLTLVFGGIFFTFRWGFVNIRLFKHCIDVVRGKYDKEDDEGEISHFQALTSALSATVGLGNIAGVAVALAAGGAGAVFWMWIIAFFGMSMKFTSCSFAQLYRRVKADGTVLGGPMVYLDEGIRERFPSLAFVGKAFGIIFACFTVMAAFGGGNMFQGNQTSSIFSSIVLMPMLGDMEADAAARVQSMFAAGIGILLAILVGVVIIGGIRRIGEVTSKLVPLMCAFYCLCCLVILVINAKEIPAMFASIFSSAFSPQAMFGGVIGVLLTGAKRAAFSNEAGLGSAAIAHAAAKTDEPVREGVVAMIGPFIDTIIVCTMTALTILITRSHLDGDAATSRQGIEITSHAFGTLGTFVPYLLCGAVFVFAYSTMISWSYYGERAVEYLVGTKGIMPYRVVYVLVVIAGPLVSLGAVVDFSDMMLLSMAFPNIIGMILLSGIIGAKLKDYTDRLNSGKMQPVK